MRAVSFFLMSALIVSSATSQIVTFEKQIFLTGREWPGEIQPTQDGGYLWIGSRSENGYCDLVLLRLNRMGDTLWSNIFGEPRSSECGSFVRETPDLEILTVGLHMDSTSTLPSVRIMKVDETGNLRWIKQYRHGKWSIPRGIVETTDGTFMITGDLDTKPFLMEITEGGDSIWLKEVSGWSEPSYMGVTTYSIDQTIDGGFVLIAAKAELTRDNVYIHPLLIRTDRYGETLWVKEFPRLTYLHGIYDIQSTFDGGYILSGSFVDTADSNKIKGLMKVDSIGNRVWLKGWQRIQSVREAVDHGYIFASFSTVAKTDVNGDILWGRKFPAEDFGALVRNTLDFGFVVTAPVYRNIYVLKTDFDGSVTSTQSVHDEDLHYRLLQNYPNPFNPSTTISYSLPHAEYVSLSIYDVLGREVVTLVNEKREAGSYQITWNAGDSPSGIYLCRMKAGEYSETRKLLLLK